MFTYCRQGNVIFSPYIHATWIAFFRSSLYDLRIAEKCWPQIAADLRLRRNFLNHAIQTFGPSACLVLLSWISFLIPPYIVPGRMVLLVTLLLVVFGSYSDAQ